MKRSAAKEVQEVNGAKEERQPTLAAEVRAKRDSRYAREREADA